LARPTFERLPYEPSVILFAGFAGALAEELRIGDIVLADEVIDEQGHTWRTTWPGELPQERWVPPLRRGRLLSVDRLITTAEEKRHLFQQHRACAVDMESAAFARRCFQAGVPFGCVRAISDEASTALSANLASLLSGGTASPMRVLKTLGRHPGMLPEMIRLARDTRHAAEQLGLALGELLTLTLPWDL
jgi:adenosylhomocysteine nucleosidase